MRELADRQFGRVTRAQLHAVGVSNGRIGRWVEDGYLRRVLPGVYAVGHVAPSIAGDLAAALLYAGPGAALSHATAAWWLKLLKRRPVTVDVTTPRRCRRLPRSAKVRVHDRRHRTRVWLRGLPVTTVPETVLDCAADGAGIDQLRLMLADADYGRLLNASAIEAGCGRGRAGSAAVKAALERHLPLLARRRSDLEADFVFLCEAAGIPLPELNVIVAGVVVDALWRERRLVIELDGAGNHGTPAQIDRDRRNELRLRQAGLLVLRYSSAQIRQQTDLVVPDVLAAYDRNANYMTDMQCCRACNALTRCFCAPRPPARCSSR